MAKYDHGAPAAILTNEALRLLRETGRSLWEQGWDASVGVEIVEPDESAVDVSLTIRIPRRAIEVAGG